VRSEICAADKCAEIMSVNSESGSWYSLLGGIAHLPGRAALAFPRSPRVVSQVYSPRDTHGWLPEETSQTRKCLNQARLYAERGNTTNGMLIDRCPLPLPVQGQVPPPG
jgi:hypothetical protein